MFHDIDYSSLIINQLPIMSDLDHWDLQLYTFVNIFVLIPDPSGDGTSCTNICLHMSDIIDCHTCVYRSQTWDLGEEAFLNIFSIDPGSQLAQ